MTVGGSTCCSEDLTPVSMGPRDQQQVEWRPDVLVYSSPVLEEDVEAIGPVKMTLYAASDAPDTDFTAKLVDVHPNGTVINVAQGIIRARYRDSWEEPTLLEPGKIYEYTIDLWSTSNRFLKGHQIRVEVSSSNFPQFDRNPNTGNTFGVDTETRVANQTIYHDAEHPSHILLPIVPVS
jgi:putative CocE/NonD family hydrolase